MASEQGAAIEFACETYSDMPRSLRIVPRQDNSQEQLIPEISDIRAGTFIDIEKGQKYAVGCLDERHPTEQSARKIERDLGVQGHIYYRVGGAAFGVARLAGVMIAVDLGPEALELCMEKAKAGGKFPDFVTYVKKRVESTSDVVFTGHSAQKNERRTAHLDHKSCRCLGCLYALKIGAVTHMQRRGGEIYSLGELEQTALFGSADLLEPVAKGNEDVMNIFFKGRSDYSLSRRVMRWAHLPAMILAGEHAPISSGLVVPALNFHPDKISAPQYANNLNKPTYNVDATAVVGWIIKAFPGLKLSPETGLAVVEHDYRAAREALARLEGLEAKDFPVQRYGGVEIGLNALQTTVTRVRAK